jgi:hypothetical protein
MKQYLDINKLKLWENIEEKNDIILNKYFLFIQIPKTSSTNVLQLCKTNGLTKIMNCYRHEGLMYLENFIDINLPVFTVVRNPYTQIFSYFFHRIHHKEIILNNEISLKENFKNFVLREIDNIHIRQYDYIISKKNISVHIIKFEDNTIIDILNNKFNLNLNKSTKLNENIDKDYIESKKIIKEFYNDNELLNLVKIKRKKEFEVFGYSLELDAI